MDLSKFNKLTYPQKSAYLTAVSLALLAALVFFLVIPTVKKVQSLRDDIIDQKIEMEERFLRQQNMSRVVAKVQEVEPKLPLLAHSYINKNRELEFITWLEGLASAHGLEQAISLDPQSGKPQGTYSTVPLGLSIKGTYGGILDYLVAVETGPYYINVSSFNLNGTRPGRSDTATAAQNLTDSPFSGTINAVTYWK